jgi:plastocyanin
MRTSRITPAVLGLTGVAALGAAAMTGAAATSHATKPPGVTRAFATGKAERLVFSTARLAAPAGKITLKVTNRGDIEHDISLRGRKLAKERHGRIVDTGGISKVVVTLKPGTYTYFCSVFGHEEGGMRGTLTVKKAR